MADHDRAEDVGTRIVAEAVTGGRTPVVNRILLGRALGVDDRIQGLVGGLDPLGGAARLFRMLGRDDRDRFAEVADAVDREHGLVGKLEPVGLRARDVGVGEYGVDAGHADGFCDINLLDQSVGMGAAQRVAPEHLGGDEVARIGELAGRLRNRVDALDALADAPALERPRRSDHSGRVLGSGTGTRPGRTAQRRPETAACGENVRIGPGLGSDPGTRPE